MLPIVFSQILSTVCMGVVVLNRWVWMQPWGPLHLSPYLLHPLPHSSLFRLARLPLQFHDTLWTLLLPPCPSPNVTALILSPLPGWLLPHLVQVTEGLVSLVPLLVLLGLLFLPTPQYLFCHQTLSPFPWVHPGLAANLSLHPPLWCPLLSDRIPVRLPLPPGFHHLGISF